MPEAPADERAEPTPFRHRLDRWVRRRRRAETFPINIDRRRVYVLPTRFGVFYTVLVGAMFLGALNYNNNPGLLLSLLLAGAGLASLVHAHLQLSGIRIESLHAEPVSAGEPLAVKLGLAATDLRPRDGLQVLLMPVSKADPPIKAVGAIQPGEHGVCVAEVATNRRGWHDLDRLEIATTRPFGLACAWTWTWPSAGWLVYPAAESQGPPLPDSQEGGRQVKPMSAGDDIHQIRPYRAGDARRAIAWKASARAAHLLTREYEQRTDADVLLDWVQVKHLPYEQAISRLTHWVELAERHGRRYALRPPQGTQLGPARGPEHRHACLEALAMLPMKTA